MAEAKVRITAEDNASGVIDHIQKKLGVFNKEGLATGVAFALATKAIQYAEQGMQYLIQSIQNGIQNAIEFEYNLVSLTNTIDDMDVSIDTLRNDLILMSNEYGIGVNTLAEEMRMFTREGYNVIESMKLLGEATRFSIANNEDFGSVVNAVNTIMEVFDMDASDSVYIFNELNDIIDETNLTAQNIADVFGSGAEAIRESGLTLEDMVNILYTLEQRGNRPQKIIRGFVDMLKELNEEGGNIELLPDEQVKNIDEKFNTINNTTKTSLDKIGAGWDNFLMGVGDALIGVADVITNPPFLKNGEFVRREPEIPPPLFTDESNNIELLTDKINKLNYAISVNGTNMRSLGAEVAKFAQERDRIQQEIDYSVAVHTATQALQKQEDAIESLRRVSEAYSLQQQENNLRILQIQYGASGRRRGLSRGEQRNIEAIERENMGLRIQEMQQQIAIQHIQQGGLRDAQDRLDMIRREHDELMYQQQLVDLKTNLDDTVALWADAVRRINIEINKLNINRFLLGQTQTNLSMANAPTTIAALIGRGMSQRVFNALGFPNARIR